MDLGNEFNDSKNLLSTLRFAVKALNGAKILAGACACAVVLYLIDLGNELSDSKKTSTYPQIRTKSFDVRENPLLRMRVKLYT